MTTVVTETKLELAHIILAHKDKLSQWFGSLGLAKTRALFDIAHCRTARMGAHTEVCAECGAQRNAYNSCRNRHCPKCLGSARFRWTQAREAELLPVPYFHVVFTIPHLLGPLFLQNPRVTYNLLFRASSETLKTVAADPRHLGAKIGFLAVLHSWGQKLDFHPHIHCIVPAGGIAPNGDEWIHGQADYLLPVRVLSRVFRGKLLDYLYRAHENGELELHGQLRRFRSPRRFKRLLAATKTTDWVVYTKRPFGGPRQVLRYLAAYTHRVALTNRRLVAMDNGRVSFTYKDYTDGNRRKTMSLSPREFLRRFLMHILPHRFMRIRYYGFLANANRTAAMAHCRQLLGASEPPPTTPDTSTKTDGPSDTSSSDGALQCPACGSTNVEVRDVTHRAFISPDYLFTPEVWDTS